MERNAKRVVLNHARGMILFSVLNSTTQTVLQAMIIRESKKIYDDFQETCSGQGSQSRITRENIVLLLLHNFAMVMHIFALMRSSDVFDLFLFTLFGLSAGCGFTQYFRDMLNCEEPCDCSERKTRVGLETARLVLALVFLIFVGLTTFLRSSNYNPGAPVYKASVPTVLFLGVGLVILAIDAKPDPLSWPLLFLWIVFAAFSIFISIVLPVLYRHLLKGQEDNAPASKPTDDAETRSTFESNIRTLSQTLPSDPFASFAQRDSIGIHETPVALSSSSATVGEYKPDHVADLFSVIPTSRSESILPEETRSAQYSFGAETFNSAVPIRDASMDESPWAPEVGQSSRALRDSLDTTSSMGTAFIAEIGSQLSPPDNRHTPLPPNEDANEDLHVTSRHSISMQPMETFPSSLPDGDNQSMTESYLSPSVSTVPPSHSPSVSINTLSVPLYTDGPYSYRPRYDTLSSDGTCETLPSYHSRQNSHTLPDLLGRPPMPPNIGSLPALPPSY
ncbi:hypothetical protein E1B28_006693 [Marasmius oreades]|uniref:Uncharacterized protein n=1 Tax=Marasmius oreades TaxID=181124 RepID=A0A9P8A9S6_9AGAR|nr:uncharacterized protein E1B28_006693 [Marasmius oreades]KAG7096011.1 hypothetical protein E1B28_006693 [Marasmius oreades]